MTHEPSPHLLTIVDIPLRKRHPQFANTEMALPEDVIAYRRGYPEQLAQSGSQQKPNLNFFRNQQPAAPTSV